LTLFFYEKIYDEKLEWSATGTMNTYNREYIEHKQRTQILREQSAKSRTQVEIFCF